MLITTKYSDLIHPVVNEQNEQNEPITSIVETLQSRYNDEKKKKRIQIRVEWATVPLMERSYLLY